MNNNDVDKNNLNNAFIIEKKNINNKNSCDKLKEKLATCMKNSDDNIIYCQSIRNMYEDCLRTN